MLSTHEHHASPRCVLLSAFTISLIALTAPPALASSGDCEHWSFAMPGIPHISTMCSYYSEDGDLYIGLNSNSTPMIRWPKNGTFWEAVGPPVNPFSGHQLPQDILIFQDMLVKASVTNTMVGVVVLTGDGWQLIDDSHMPRTGTVWSLIEYNDQLIAAGDFLYVYKLFSGGGVNPKFIVPGTRGIAAWDPKAESGERWTSVSGGLPSGHGGAIRNMIIYEGELIVAGTFLEPHSRIMKSVGDGWMPLDGGVNGTIWTMTIYQGDLIVGGTFSEAGGNPANRVARWNGNFWQPMGSGLGDTSGTNQVRSLAVHNGVLYAGGGFGLNGDGDSVQNIARWDPSAEKWVALEGTNCPGIPSTGCGVNGSSVLYSDGSRLLIGPLTYAGGEQISPQAMAAYRPTCTTPGDLNGDGVVNVFDMLDLLSSWGDCAVCSEFACPADLNGDCTVNVFDLLILLANWG